MKERFECMAEDPEICSPWRTDREPHASSLSILKTDDYVSATGSGLRAYLDCKADAVSDAVDGAPSRSVQNRVTERASRAGLVPAQPAYKSAIAIEPVVGIGSSQETSFATISWENEFLPMPDRAAAWRMHELLDPLRMAGSVDQDATHLAPVVDDGTIGARSDSIVPALPGLLTSPAVQQVGLAGALPPSLDGDAVRPATTRVGGYQGAAA